MGDEKEAPTGLAAAATHLPTTLAGEMSGDPLTDETMPPPPLAREKDTRRSTADHLLPGCYAEAMPTR